MSSVNLIKPEKKSINQKLRRNENAALINKIYFFRYSGLIHFGSINSLLALFHEFNLLIEDIQSRNELMKPAIELMAEMICGCFIDFRLFLSEFNQLNQNKLIS